MAERRAGPDAGRVPAWRASSSCSRSLTYIEGNSLHPERGGASTFARYAFDELWSFIAGWAILLDYLIVMAFAAFAVAALPDGVLGRRRTTRFIEVVIAALVLACVAVSNMRGAVGRPAAAVLRLSLLNIVLLAC